MDGMIYSKNNPRYLDSVVLSFQYESDAAVAT
jgi:hypothetical protein